MKIKSFGKINLNLRVLDALVNGLHKIESLIVPIDLYDVIEIKEIKNCLLYTSPSPRDNR